MTTSRIFIAPSLFISALGDVFSMPKIIFTNSTTSNILSSPSVLISPEILLESWLYRNSNPPLNIGYQNTDGSPPIKVPFTAPQYSCNCPASATNVLGTSYSLRRSDITFEP